MRKTVFKILMEHENESIYLNLRLKDLNKSEDVIKNITIRVYGVVQNYSFLEYKISEVTKGKKIDSKTKILLMMALFEYIYLDSVPEYAVISEYTNLAHSVTSKSVKFISYFLNNELKIAAKAEPHFGNEMKNIAITYSHPQWVVKKLADQYENFLDIIKTNQTRKIITARVINDLVEPENFEKFHFDDLLKCKVNILNTIDFKNGNVIIQDFGSYLVSKLVSASQEEIVLDLCAAPGNKTMHISKNAKHVFANEINTKRFELMNRNIEKNNILNVSTTNCDATILSDLITVIGDTKFDKILVDAPCSGWGVFRSKPDIKFKQDIHEVENIKKIQYQILVNAYELLNPGGELIYSTCTLNKEENEQQVSKLINEKNMTEVLDDAFKCFGTKNQYGFTLTPDAYNCDGFYMCKLKKGYDE